MAAFVEDSKSPTAKLTDNEIIERFCRSGGKGGQNVNKVNSAVQLTHVPTGISVRVEQRKQGQNRRVARERLEEKLSKKAKKAKKKQEAEERRAQIGKGIRGEKIRTIDQKHGYAVSHGNSAQTSYTKYCKGHVADLW